MYHHTRLIRAAMDANNIPVLEYLIDRFKDEQPKPPWRIDYRPIMQALHRLEHFKLFYVADPTITTWSIGYVENPLGYAVLWKQVEVVDFLLGEGLDPNEGRAGGEPAICSAVRAGDLQIANMLLDHGATVKGSDMLAIAQAAGWLEMIKLLVLKGGMDVNMVQRTDERFPKPESIEIDSRKRYSFASASSVNSVKEARKRAADEKPVLHRAVEMGQADMVKGLLRDLGADPNVKDGLGRTAFDVAKEKENQRIIRLLTEKSR